MSLRIAIPEADLSTRGTLDPQPDLLDAFVAEYERELANDEPEMPDFFYKFVPSRMLRDVLATDPRKLPRQGFLWVMMVAGYYAGTFIRREIRRIQLEAMVVLPGVPIARSLFERISQEAELGAAAAVGSSCGALAYAEQVFDEIVTTFERVKGATLGMIVADPRHHVDDLLIPGGLLWCGYREPRLPVVAGLHDVSRSLEGGDREPWQRLADRVRAIREVEAERGQAAWADATKGLAGRTVFAQLIALSAAYVECLQAAALLTTRALAFHDGATARVASLACAIVLLGRQSSLLGLMDSSHDASDDALPVFTS